MNFFESVYAIVRKIPSGKVATYGQIALFCANPRASRVVGYALHANPSPGDIPCHRVVNRLGYLSGGFAFGGIDAQKSLLMQEGVFVNKEYRVEIAKYLWDGGKASCFAQKSQK